MICLIMRKGALVDLCLRRDAVTFLAVDKRNKAQEYFAMTLSMRATRRGSGPD